MVNTRGMNGRGRGHRPLGPPLGPQIRMIGAGRGNQNPRQQEVLQEGSVHTTQTANSSVREAHLANQLRIANDHNGLMRATMEAARLLQENPAIAEGVGENRGPAIAPRVGRRDVVVENRGPVVDQMVPQRVVVARGSTFR